MTSEVVRALADKYSMKTGDLIPPRPKARETVGAATARARPARPMPAAIPALSPPQRVKWSEERRDLFDRWGVVALYVAGTRGPEPRGLGDNRLCWWLRFGITANYHDSITRIARDWHPNGWQGVWFRLWTPSREHCVRLQELVIDALAPIAGPVAMADVLDEMDLRTICASRHENSELWLDVGSDFDAKVGLPNVPSASLDAEAKARRFNKLRFRFASAIRQLAGRNVIETWDDEGIEAALERMEAEQAARDVGKLR
jgi:hypothetical protein